MSELPGVRSLVSQHDKTLHSQDLRNLELNIRQCQKQDCLECSFPSLMEPVILHSQDHRTTMMVLPTCRGPPPYPSELHPTSDPSKGVSEPPRELKKCPQPSLLNQNIQHQVKKREELEGHYEGPQSQSPAFREACDEERPQAQRVISQGGLTVTSLLCGLRKVTYGSSLVV